QLVEPTAKVVCKLELGNSKLHSVYTTLAVGSTSLPSTDQNPKYFQTSLFRFLGVTITFSAAVKLGSVLSAILSSDAVPDSTTPVTCSSPQARAPPQSRKSCRCFVFFFFL